MHFLPRQIGMVQLLPSRTRHHYRKKNIVKIVIIIIRGEKVLTYDLHIFQFCQLCRKGDNEALLLLCDGCDKGFHTYCFKPKMETIPEGDWYCSVCVSKVRSGDIFHAILTNKKKTKKKKKKIYVEQLHVLEV